MNTNMTGFRKCCVLVLCKNVASALEGLIYCHSRSIGSIALWNKVRFENLLTLLKYQACTVFSGYNLEIKDGEISWKGL